MFRTEKSFFF